VPARCLYHGLFVEAGLCACPWFLCSAPSPCFALLRLLSASLQGRWTRKIVACPALLNEGFRVGAGLRASPALLARAVCRGWSPCLLQEAALHRCRQGGLSLRWLAVWGTGRPQRVAPTRRPEHAGLLVGEGLRARPLLVPRAVCRGRPLWLPVVPVLFCPA
jgi:hypothetical protein